MEDVDSILRIYHTAIVNGELKVGQSAVLDRLIEKVRFVDFLCLAILPQIFIPE